MREVFRADETPTMDDVKDRWMKCRHTFTYAEAEDEFDRAMAAHDAKVRAEQRETDAVIAETRYFGGDNIGSANRWGAKQAAAAIRAVPANTNTEEA